MEEIEIKIEYNETFEADPLKERKGRNSNHSKCSGYYFEDIPNSIDNSVGEVPLYKHFPPRLPTPPIPSKAYFESKEGYNNYNASDTSVPHTWYRHVDENGKMMCRYCDHAYSLVQSLRVHVKNKHPNEANTLKIANEKAKRTPKMYCHLCTKKFNDTDQLKSHVRQHSIQEVENYICNFCALIFISKDEIKQHLEESHADENCFYFIKKKMNKDIKRYQCPECTHIAKRRYALTRHIKAKHTTANDVTFKCEFCTYRASVKCYLQNHVASQHPESEYAQSKRKHVCDICGYRTPRKSHYDQHKRQHLNGEKAHKCDHCDYETNLLGNLNVHRRKHTLEKPYSCNFEGCEYKCAAKTALKSHQMRHDSENCRKWFCDKCNYSTIYKNSLKKHIDGHNRNSQKIGRWSV